MCHILQFCAMSSVILYAFMSSLVLSIHHVLGIHLLLFPRTCTFNIFLVVYSPSCPNTWPCHLSRLFLRKVFIGSMSASLQMSSFLMWYFLVLPLVAQLSILISVVCSLCVSFFLTATQRSDRYTIAGLTIKHY